MTESSRPSAWTATEIDLLRQIYPARGAKAAARVLPGRTLATIRKRANLMGLMQLRADGEPRKSPVRKVPAKVVSKPISDLDRYAPACWGYQTERGELRASL